MKKLFLLVVGITCLTVTKAQVHLGVKAGFNFASFSGSDASNVSTRTSAHLGLVAKVPLALGLSFQPELVYSGQGAKQGSTTFSTTYINVPVLAKYTIPVLGLFVETGPQVGFLLSAKASTDAGTTDVKSQLNKTDLSWAFGAGFKLPLGLGIDLRYNAGLSKIPTSGANIKNSVIQLGAFFMIP